MGASVTNKMLPSQQLKQQKERLRRWNGKNNMCSVWTLWVLSASVMLHCSLADQPGYKEKSINNLPAQYAFQWKVKDDYSKNDYGQKEARDGDITKGQYHVLLPDGRTQKVSYTVDSYNG